MAKKKFKELQLLARSQNWALGGMHGRTRMTMNGLCNSINQIAEMLPEHNSLLRRRLELVEWQLRRECNTLLRLQDQISIAFAAQREELRTKLESESNGN